MLFLSFALRPASEACYAADNDERARKQAVEVERKRLKDERARKQAIVAAGERKRVEEERARMQAAEFERKRLEHERALKHSAELDPGFRERLAEHLWNVFALSDRERQEALQGASLVAE